MRTEASLIISGTFLAASMLMLSSGPGHAAACWVTSTCARRSIERPRWT
jgi:hypothetical protein